MTQTRTPRHALVDVLILAWLAIVAFATLRPFAFEIPLAIRTQIFPAPTWSPVDGMVFRGTGSFSFRTPAPEVADAIEAAGAFHVYVELRPDTRAQEGPARVVTYSISDEYQAFMLGQSGSDLVFRLADPSRDRSIFRGHEYHFDARLSPDEWHHVLVTVTPQELRLWSDGRVVERYFEPVFEPSAWSRACRLAAGNEPNLGRPWRGRIRSLVVGAGPAPRRAYERVGLPAVEIARLGLAHEPDVPAGASGAPLPTPILEVSTGGDPPPGFRVSATPETRSLRMPWSLRPFTEPAHRKWARTDWTQNVLLLLPLGALLAFRRLRPLPIALVLLGVSLTIELTQLFLPARYTQTTDLVLNVAGGLLGAIVADRLLAAARKPPAPHVDAERSRP